MNNIVNEATMTAISKISSYIADLCIKANAKAPDCEYKESEFGIEFPKKGNAKLIKEIENLGYEVGAYKAEKSNYFVCYAIFSHKLGLNIESKRGNGIDYRKWKAA